MRFTDVFIKRPVLAVSISFLIVLLGLQAIFKMQVREYPEMTNTVITVSTGYYGASADLIQGFITQPLEQAVAQADNIDFMTSQSVLGRSTITVTMKLNTDPNAALSDVLAKTNSVRSQLPKEAEDPTVTMSTGSTTAVLYIGFTSNELASSQITDYLERVVNPQLYAVNGVSSIDLYGGMKYALRVWLDPAKMAALNLSAADVMSILNANNYQSATGQAIGEFVLYNGSADTQVSTVEDLESLVVKAEKGTVTRLGDIAKVTLAKSHDTYRASANGREAVVAAINAAPSANPINIAKDVLEMLPELQKNMPSNFESLFTIATDVLTEVKANPMFVYSDLDLNFDSATMKINIDKDKAGAYGVTMQDIGITLSTMMADGYVNRIDLNGRSYEVIPQVERKWRLNPESMNSYYVRAADGKVIPLGSLVTIDVVAEPRSLPHFNQLNSATVGAVPAPGTAMGDAINWFENLASSKLPKGYSHDYMGEARQYVTEGSALYATFGLALAIIFLVLAIQFESLRDPLVIMVSVPLAICGALIALAWGTATMNIYSQVGLITLVGLITKHGILICEVAKEEQLHNKLSRIEAVMHAAKVRLRPILMTTAAMIAGLIPLMYATGAGAAQRFSIGIVIVSGLAIGTLFTLFVLPVIYSYLAEKHKPLPVFVEDKDLEKLARIDEAKAAHRQL